MFLGQACFGGVIDQIQNETIIVLSRGLKSKKMVKQEILPKYVKI